MAEKFRWGVIGTGIIACKFGEAIAALDDAEIIAVTNRTRAKADAFAERFAIETVYDTNAELLADERIDAVYVATLNIQHYDVVKEALLSGKNVLCEKPIVMQSEQVEELVAIAREQDVLLCENLWTRFLPIYDRLRTLIADGGIGEVRVVHADYFFRMEFDPNDRFFNPDLGGGALYDIGVYGLGFIGTFLGYEPDRVFAVGRLGSTGVDEVLHLSLGYPNGAMADATFSISTPAPFRAMVIGTRGRIEIPEYGRATTATVYQYPDVEAGRNSKGTGTVSNVPEGTTSYVIEEPFKQNGFEYIASAVADAIRAGKKETDLLTCDEIVTWVKLKESIRADLSK
ncbi:MAG: Gfo/Idh/MocA family oxidoreductase [Coriobacteriia bacterium]|nr:Gfo/Idh/MocA family oxidoreductase [Coriobacteriia bacterium]